MVIQRWQSVYLLIAGILTLLFCFVPMALISNATSPDSLTPLHPTDVPVMMVIDLLGALLLFIAIFMYRNTKRQKMITLISMMLIIATLATEGILLWKWDSEVGHTEWLGSAFLLIGAVGFAILAIRGIRKDERLLRDTDRLR